ncbi:MAG TPA: GspH/FimT family pseudopilin [Thiobacillaceae bacterium]|nr:GspH/FimT family pseudopilin [Thiobacillaceae bacterium]
MHPSPQNPGAGSITPGTGSPASRVGGFTMIELLITIVVAAILMTVAIPSFLDFVRNNRLTAQANDLVLGLTYARSEAVKRGVRVTVCSRQNDTTCAASATWDDGWLVFVDTDGDGAVDTGEVILRVRAPLESGNTLRAANLRRVTFQSTGFNPGFADTFRLCDARGTGSARQLVLSLQGRMTTTTGTAQCP